VNEREEYGRKEGWEGPMRQTWMRKIREKRKKRQRHESDKSEEERKESEKYNKKEIIPR
jgi:hypothetical protein